MGSTILNAQQPSFLGMTEAKNELQGALKSKTNSRIYLKKNINDKQTAIAVAEPILFKIYGENQIIGERPYEVYLINGYWVLNGTIPENSFGGGFLIIFSVKDGRVIKLTHYK
jgi:hypothetical protein